jgi:hypothetical protein
MTKKRVKSRKATRRTKTGKIKAGDIRVRRTPEQKIMEQLESACPGVKKSEGAMRQSWEALAMKIALAKRMGTYVFCVTPNSEILDNKETLRKLFGCEVLSPLEARYGFDSIEKF